MGTKKPLKKRLALIIILWLNEVIDGFNIKEVYYGKKKKTGKDLLKAAQNADYDGIIACLNDGVSVNYTKREFGRLRSGCYEEINALAELMYNAGLFPGDQTVKCIEVLLKNGANINQSLEDLAQPMDFMHPYKTKNPEDLYHVARFVLTHGGCTGRYDNYDDLKERLEEYAHMPKEEFEFFREIGRAYLWAIKEGIDFNLEEPLTALIKMRREEKIKKDNDLRKAKRSEFLYGQEYDDVENFSLLAIKRAKDRGNFDLKELDAAKTKRLEELHHGIPERDEKAIELKALMRERDASGKKMGLRAYLKSKTAPKVVSKNARITKRGGNNGNDGI